MVLHRHITHHRQGGHCEAIRHPHVLAIKEVIQEVLILNPCVHEANCTYLCYCFYFCNKHWNQFRKPRVYFAYNFQIILHKWDVRAGTDGRMLEAQVDAEAIEGCSSCFLMTSWNTFPDVVLPTVSWACSDQWFMKKIYYRLFHMPICRTFFLSWGFFT